VLEEGAEVFGAWQEWSRATRGNKAHMSRRHDELLDECADVIQATCNLLAALGVEDATLLMLKCRRRNEERGRL
jgi:phosphoribosyl-ATP pyrophosphohydrolase